MVIIYEHQILFLNHVMVSVTCLISILATPILQVVHRIKSELWMLILTFNDSQRLPIQCVHEILHFAFDDTAAIMVRNSSRTV